MPIPLTSTLLEGNYIIKYQSTDLDNNTRIIQRTLQYQRNTIPPTITLLGESSVDMIRTNTYIDPGAISKSSFNDVLKSYIINIDGWMTIDKEAIPNTPIPITATLPHGIYNIIYKTTDYDDNSSQCTRTLNIIKNIIPPIMELVGPSSVSSILGEIYYDLGVISKSFLNEDLITYAGSIGGENIDRIIVVGEGIFCDSMNYIGTYDIIYITIDLDGNTQTITRILNITN